MSWFFKIYTYLHLCRNFVFWKQWNCNGVGYCWCEKKILFFLILITMFSWILIYSRSNTVLMCTKNIFKTCHFTGKISHFVKTRSSLSKFWGLICGICRNLNKPDWELRSWKIINKNILLQCMPQMCEVSQPFPASDISLPSAGICRHAVA